MSVTITIFIMILMFINIHDQNVFNPDWVILSDVACTIQIWTLQIKSLLINLSAMKYRKLNSTSSDPPLKLGGKNICSSFFIVVFVVYNTNYVRTRFLYCSIFFWFRVRPFPKSNMNLHSNFVKHKYKLTVLRLLVNW